MAFRVFAFVLAFVTLLNTGDSLKIKVIQNGSVLSTYTDENAEYNDKSINVPQEPIVAQLVYAAPQNACSAVESRNGSHLFAFIEEYTRCTIAAEVNLYTAGYLMMIATTQYRVGLEDATELPKALVSEDFGLWLKRMAIANFSPNASSVYLSVSEDGFKLYERLFIIFGSILLAAVVVAVLIFCCSICCRLVAGKWRTRGLSQWRVRQLPKRRYKHDGETCETCSICLEDFKEGEPVRVLPCEHVFHPKCVDEWLQKWNRTCPLCKSSIRRRGGAVRGPSTSEHAQLIPSEGPETEEADGEGYGAVGYGTNPLTDTETDYRSLAGSSSSSESESTPRGQRGGSQPLSDVVTLERSSPPSLAAAVRTPEMADDLEDVDLGPELTTLPKASGNDSVHA